MLQTERRVPNANKRQKAILCNAKNAKIGEFSSVLKTPIVGVCEIVVLGFHLDQLESSCWTS